MPAPNLASDVRATRSVVEQVRDIVGDDDRDFITIVENETDTIERVRKIIRQVIYAEANATAMKEIVEANQARKKRFEDQAARLKRVALWAIQEMALPDGKLPAVDFTAGIRKGRGGIVVTDISKLPEEFIRRTDPEAKIREIEAALKEGRAKFEDLPIERKNGVPYLDIRTT